MTTPLDTALSQLSTGTHLSAEQAAAAFGVVMRGEATHEQIRELLVGLKEKGETADEVAGAASAMRAAMIRLPHVPRTTPHIPLVDTCGTGGGIVGTFNVSTTAAFVVAGAGVPVAKHGNRSFTSRSGSADVLEALGLDIALPPERAAEVLARVGLVFLFAPTYHPAMRHAAPVRQELQTTTIFNLLGPLANPASVTRQIIGVSDPERGPIVAEALARLGADHALVVHAEVGMDEISPVGLTRVWEVRRTPHSRPGQAPHGAPVVREWTLDPADHDLRQDDLSALQGGEPAENADRLRRLLRSPFDDPSARAAVLLNAAAAIYVSGESTSYASAVQRATNALDQGMGLTVFRELKEAGS